MNNVKNNSNSNLPLLIIGAVLLVAILGGWWFYSSSSAPIKPTPKTAKTPTVPTPDPKDIYNKSPVGAQPPNMLGSAAAAVTVEEFADYQCPTCATVHPMMQELNKIYGNRIKFVYRSFPLTTIHAHAYEAAIAAEAAGLQNKFWEMQTQLFSNQKEWSTSAQAAKLFEGYAQNIGLDLTKYQNDVLGLAAKARVDADMARGRALSITGTPSIYINGTSVAFQQFNVDALRQLIDGELQKSSNQPTNQAAVQTKTNSAASNANSSNTNK